MQFHSMFTTILLPYLWGICGSSLVVFHITSNPGYGTSYFRDYYVVVREYYVRRDLCVCSGLLRVSGLIRSGLLRSG